MLVRLCISLHLIPLDPDSHNQNADPDPRTQINADPTGSGSSSLIVSKEKSIHVSYFALDTTSGRFPLVLMLMYLPDYSRCG